MSILRRYICQHIISATVLVVLILLAITGMLELARQVSDVGSGHYELLDAMQYTAMQMPMSLYQLFPMAGFLGCLIGLGRLASSSQLIVVRLAGVSKLQIAGIAVIAAVLMMVFVTFVGEVVAPSLQQKAVAMKAKKTGLALPGMKQEDVWLRNGKYFVHIGKIINVMQLSDVSVFEISPKFTLQKIYYAPRAEKQANVWRLLSVTETEFLPERVKIQRSVAWKLPIEFNPLEFERARKDVTRLSLLGLHHAIQYRYQAHLPADRYVFAFWQRVIQPFTAIVMIVLGVPFVFGSLRSASTGQKLLVGIFVGFAFYMLNQFFGPVAVLYEVEPVLAAVFPTIVFAVLCVILLRRTV